ncbi:hypothetical protein PM038_15655 [Halorubrum ezzemoulense]|nr:hypothetical protein [Halorubrum ezzemoulense]MDB2286671.1 hypothetical protein [Halorubrum ezzemoulense]
MAVCTALGCTHDAEVVIRLEDGRERPVCPGDADDGEVVGDV